MERGRGPPVHIHSKITGEAHHVHDGARTLGIARCHRRQGVEKRREDVGQIGVLVGNPVRDLQSLLFRVLYDTRTIFESGRLHPMRELEERQSSSRRR